MKGGENMKCPFCFNDESKVVDSRSTDESVLNVTKGILHMKR